MAEIHLAAANRLFKQTDLCVLHLDPIEQVFAKLKNTLRKMAHRTVDALWDAIGIALDDFSPEACFNYFRNFDEGGI
jgi:hypothetical protein